MTAHPIVSVIIPVYNAEKYAKESIDSILNQTYQNFELIIVNDFSTDNSKKIIDKIIDKRISIINNFKNEGLAKSVNRGILQSVGKYIVRMDADDIALPKRLEKQVEFMEKNPGIGLSGTWMKSFGSTQFKKKYPTTPEQCSLQLFFDVPVGHPSVIFRLDLLKKHNLFYNDDLKTYGEDYELWTRFSKVTNISNIPKYLLKYRVINSSDRKEEQEKRQKSANLIRNKMLKDWLNNDASIDLNAHIILSSPLLPLTENNTTLNKIEEWAMFLINNNKKMNAFADDLFTNTISFNFFLVCYHNPYIGGFKKFYTSTFRKASIPLSLQIKFLIKIILHKK